MFCKLALIYSMTAVVFSTVFFATAQAATFEQGKESADSILASPVQVKQFRVLIFPHFGDYATPEGAEASATSVTVTSTKPCSVYIADQDFYQEWIKVGDPVQSATSFVITPKSIQTISPKAAYYHCEAAFTVHRGGTLTSFTYPGDFVAMPDDTDVKLINILNPETYIQGVVPSEVGGSWPDDVLKAQAIAARTYAWWTVLVNRNKTLDYDMDDTVQYQAYTGVSKRTTAADAAVVDTQNKVLKSDGHVIKAYFSADSGGYTESSLAAFGGALPYCTAKRESYTYVPTMSNWNRTFTQAALTAVLVKAKVIPAGSVIKKLGIQPKDRTESGRVKQVTVVLADGTAKRFPAADFRQLVSLRSTLFNVRLYNGTVTIDGKGYGHGVGMSQDGALLYVKQLKWSFDQILKFYYTGTTIEDEI